MLSYEEASGAALAARHRAALIDAATECTLTYCTPSGWPTGVVMSYVHRGGSFWVTTAGWRTHARAMSRDPRVGLVISNAGTGLPGRRMVTIRGLAALCEHGAERDEVLEAFVHRLAPASPSSFRRILLAGERLLFRITPEAYPISHDSLLLPGDGRGGPSNTSPAESGKDVPE